MPIINCPICGGEGDMEDEDGDWADCEACDGVGEVEAPEGYEPPEGAELFDDADDEAGGADEDESDEPMRVSDR